MRPPTQALEMCGNERRAGEARAETYVERKEGLRTFNIAAKPETATCNVVSYALRSSGWRSDW